MDTYGTGKANQDVVAAIAFVLKQGVRLIGTGSHWTLETQTPIAGLDTSTQFNSVTSAAERLYSVFQSSSSRGTSAA